MQITPPHVSVCVPVYNAERYIEKCVQRLMEQTFDNLEYIFVNDDTPDSSFDILHKVIEEYPDRKSQIKIINHDKNRGVCEARKTAIYASKGEYIIHCDPDDLPELDYIQQLYEAAIENDADIVWCDYLSFIGDNESIYHSQKPSKSLEPSAVLNDMIDGNKTGNLWSHLVKREIVFDDDIIFPSWNFGEDISLMFQYFNKSRKVYHIPKALYRYRINPDGICNTVDASKFARYVADDFKTIDLIQRCTTSSYIYRRCLSKQFYKRRRIFELYGYGRYGMKKWREYNRHITIWHLLICHMGMKEKIYHAILYLKSYISLTHK